MHELCSDFFISQCGANRCYLKCINHKGWNIYDVLSLEELKWCTNLLKYQKQNYVFTQNRDLKH